MVTGNSLIARGDVPGTPRADIITRSITTPPASSRLMFHQHAPPVLVTASNAAGVAGVTTFALSGLEGAATLQTLFDFYRIRAVKVGIRPQNNAIGVVDPTVTKLVELYHVIDYNDATPLSGAAVAREFDNCVILFPGETLSRTLEPKMSAVVRSAAGTDYMSVAPQWLNTGSDDVLHYGTKYWVPQVNAVQTVVQTWQIDVEYWIEFQKVTG